MTQVKKYSGKSALQALGSSLKSIFSVSNDQERNRYSVLYRINEQYHHVGYSSQSGAQTALSLLTSDENRIAVGIYDAKTDTFEWEIIGQYLHSQYAPTEQHTREQQMLTIARALRRRDSSWQPGYLQKPGFFA
jgi:hypothetical protein